MRSRLIVVPLALVLGACASPATAIVLAIDSDLAVPSELSSIHVEVAGTAACTTAACGHDFTLTGSSAIALPFSFGVVPAGDPGPVSLVVRGRDASGADRVVRTVDTSFVAGRTLLLQVWLERACLDASACGLGETCIAGACTSDRIDAAQLHDYVPGLELAFDGSVRDAGVGDGGIDASSSDTGASDADLVDASAIDAFVPDTGVLPRTCADVPVTTPSGTFTIDPDGASGVAPFLDYCETSADGGGWTLIAKVDPSSAALRFNATPWTALASSAWIGTPDMAVGDALLPSYWLMQVRELRIVMASPATPTVTTSLVTTMSAQVSLRVAMESGVGVTLDATPSQWTTLVGASHALGAATCETSGVPAAIPAAAPTLMVRIGYVWSDVSGCTQGAFWAGVGVEGVACTHGAAGASGGGRLCGTGAEREDLPRAAWVFGR